MNFSRFDEMDWDFLRAAVTVGLQAPDIDEKKGEIVEIYLKDEIPGQAWSEELAKVLREAFETGWNVATENGTNEMAERHRHVAEAVGIPLQPAGTPAL